MGTRFDIIRALDAKRTIEAYLNGKPVEYLKYDSMEWVKVDLHLDSVYELQNILRTVRLFDLADKFNNMEDNTCKQA